MAAFRSSFLDCRRISASSSLDDSLLDRPQQQSHEQFEDDLLMIGKDDGE